MGLEVEVHQATHISQEGRVQIQLQYDLIWLKFLGWCNKVTPGKFIMAQSSKCLHFIPSKILHSLPQCNHKCLGFPLQKQTWPVGKICTTLCINA